MIDLGNLGRPSERQLGFRRDGRPPDNLVIFVGKDAGCDRAAAELLHVDTASRAD
jgi:hypothetical protein